LSLSKQYTTEVGKRFSYTATWLPNTVVKPGDVGKLTDYKFDHLTNLNKLGIEYEVTAASPKLDDFEFTSKEGVTFITKLSGESPITGSCFTDAEAGLSIKFSNEKATVFQLKNCTSKAIVDVHSLGKQILKLADKKEWTMDMVVVTEVVKTSSATILISDAPNAEINFLVKGKVASKGFSLADIGANFKVVKKQGLATEIIAKNQLTPLFRAFGLKKPLFGSVTPTYRDSMHFEISDRSFKGKGSIEAPVRRPANEIRFESVDYSDFDKNGN
jgi:hypothetical protein